MASKIPNEPPPSYATATGSSAASSSANAASSHLDIPNNSRIPLQQRRSMEDEVRNLPPGWVRQFDEKSHHHFYVDTTKEPPRSIWHHPYDDEQYLSTLGSEERERLEQEKIQREKNPSKADIIAAHSDDEDIHHHGATAGPSTIPNELPPRPEGKGKAPDNRTFGRKFKDKVTGTSHEERVAERKKRAELEQQAYEQHIRLRQAMVEAQQTGRPVLVGKDNTGRDVYVEPPAPYPGMGAYPGAYRYDPYAGGAGTYTTPNARYIRPAEPYGRPYGSGYGYGSGAGAGTGLLLGGGLGLLLGSSLLF